MFFYLLICLLCLIGLLFASQAFLQLLVILSLVRNYVFNHFILVMLVDFFRHLVVVVITNIIGDRFILITVFLLNHNLRS